MSQSLDRSFLPRDHVAARGPWPRTPGPDGRSRRTVARTNPLRSDARRAGFHAPALHSRLPSRGDRPARVVLINHGSPPHAEVRPTMQPAKCESEAVQWFLARGYLVVIGMRRGYGATGGYRAEAIGTACSAEGYANAARESARDMDAIVTYATALPYARPDGVVVIGQSAGGWGADAYNSLPHPKVIAMVSMAGGTGSHQHDISEPDLPPGGTRTRRRDVRGDRDNANALDLYGERLVLRSGRRRRYAHRVHPRRRQGGTHANRTVRRRWAHAVFRPRRFGDLGTDDRTLPGVTRRRSLTRPHWLAYNPRPPNGRNQSCASA